MSDTDMSSVTSALERLAEIDAAASAVHAECACEDGRFPCQHDNERYYAARDNLAALRKHLLPLARALAAGRQRYEADGKTLVLCETCATGGAHETSCPVLAAQVVMQQEALAHLATAIEEGDK